MRRQSNSGALCSGNLRAVLAGQTGGSGVFDAMLAQICARLLPDVMIKDVLGSLPIHPFDTTGERLLAALRNLGFVARPMPQRVEHLKPWHLPALLIEEASERIFLLLWEGGALVAYDQDGVLPDHVPLPQGQMHCLARDAHFDPLSEESRKHSQHSWLRALVDTFRPLRWVIILCTAFITIASLAQPFAISAFYRSVFSRGDKAATPWLALALVLVLVGIQAVMALRSHALAWLAARLNYLVGRATFDKIMQLPASQTQRLDAKDQSARIRSFESVSDFLTSPLAVTLLDIPTALLGLVFIGLIMPPAGLLLVVVVVAYAAIFVLGGRRMKVLTSMTSDLATELQHRMVETFEKRELIRECGLQHRWADLAKRRIARAQNVSMRISLLMATVEACSSFTFAISFIGVIGILACWSGQYQLASAQLLGVVFLTGLVVAPMHGLCMALPRFEQSKRALKQINQLMQMESENSQDIMRRRLPSLHGQIALRNITMRMGDGRPLILGLDMDTRPGEIIGITGAAGTGKSLVLKLLQGMIQPSFGTVRIEGVDIEQLPLRALRSAIGYVPQDPGLLPGTLRENLAMANPLATQEQIERVLEIVGLQNISLDQDDCEVDRLDGFIWHFSLAQALLCSNGILLIDEIPNAVVNGSFGKVLQNVIRSAKGRLTVFFVTGRSDILALADRVMVLRHARTPAIMTPADLAEVA
ncbi:ATP-binding cassette domain-containing protein [Novosphingobium sp. KACC 22771]|uniref:ATP-binding cassette domain-containing protein n=1 Tax=Novosphingobium sp. KACC 22771 TaxID=3025670 RepID=UPI0023660D20|nr:ATP-binding cassette domain-containing protein [Novosphingobium sp. KACC 22771]WDF74050.1 ATP-binding cassette domain-containing protein [Novosphingobium sp. KACC 22771]